MTSTLKQDTRCCYCHGKMMAGEAFKWVRKQTGAGSKVGAVKDVWRPAHPDGVPCLLEQIEEERQRQEENGRQLVRDALKDLPDHVAAAAIAAVPWLAAK